MGRKYQIIYIWSFIIVSGVVLLLLYTPMGGNLHKAAYGEKNRYMVAPGVNYQTQVGDFKGAYSSGSGGGQTEVYMSDNYRNGSLGNNTSVIGGTNGISTGNGFGGGSATSGGTRGSKGSDLSGGGFGGMTLAMGGGTSSSSSGGGGGMPFSSSGSSSVMQRATDGTTADDTNTDPGGEDGLGDPLPLKDDLIVLTLISVIYAFYRFKKK